MIAVATRVLPPVGPVTIACTREGLCLLSLQDAPAALDRLARRHPGERFQEDSAACEEPFRQLEEYLAGHRTRFTLPLDLRGTPFQREVWQAVAAIPYGETRSYADIAARIGRPTACRAVGAANGDNPVCIVVPCHRVVGTDGRLTGYAYGLPLKQTLLQLEAR